MIVYDITARLDLRANLVPSPLTLSYNMESGSEVDVLFFEGNSSFVQERWKRQFILPVKWVDYLSILEHKDFFFLCHFSKILFFLIGES